MLLLNSNNITLVIVIESFSMLLILITDQEEFPDRGQHDWYCFNCHLGDGSGCVVYCSNCPRIYHVKCLNVDLHTGYSKFTCPRCEVRFSAVKTDSVVGDR